MDWMIAIYLMNLAVMISMFLATLYRAWMERENLEARRKLEKLNMILCKEADNIKKMDGEEFIEMLRIVLGKK